jgi:hypothetical protein
LLLSSSQLLDPVPGENNQEQVGYLIGNSAIQVIDKLKSHLQKSEVVIRSLGAVALILPKLQLGG